MSVSLWRALEPEMTYEKGTDTVTFKFRFAGKYQIQKKHTHRTVFLDLVFERNKFHDSPLFEIVHIAPANKQSPQTMYGSKVHGSVDFEAPIRISFPDYMRFNHRAQCSVIMVYIEMKSLNKTAPSLAAPITN